VILGWDIPANVSLYTIESSRQKLKILEEIINYIISSETFNYILPIGIPIGKTREVVI